MRTNIQSWSIVKRSASIIIATTTTTMTMTDFMLYIHSLAVWYQTSALNVFFILNWHFKSQYLIWWRFSIKHSVVWINMKHFEKMSTDKKETPLINLFIWYVFYVKETIIVVNWIFLIYPYCVASLPFILSKWILSSELFSSFFFSLLLFSF